MENDGNNPWAVAGSHQNKVGKGEWVGMQHGGWKVKKLRGGQVMCAGKGMGRVGGWESEDVGQCHSTTMRPSFFCLTGHFLLKSIPGLASL